MVDGSTDGGSSRGVIDRGGGSIDHGDSDDSVVRGGIEDSGGVGRGGGALNWGLRLGGSGTVDISFISSAAGTFLR